MIAFGRSIQLAVEALDRARLAPPPHDHAGFERARAELLAELSPEGRRLEFAAPVEVVSPAEYKRRMAVLKAPR